MKNFFLKLFGVKQSKNKGFSYFFTNASSAEKKKVIERVTKQANEDQKNLVEKFNRKYSRI